MIVATDDERIQRAVIAFGGMRGPDVPAPSERHRPARRSRRLTHVRHRRQRAGRRAAHRAGDDRRRRGAASQRIRRWRCRRFAAGSTQRADIDNPNITKVVVDRDGYALYFSRAPIPLRAQRRAGGPRPGAMSGCTSIAASACCASPRSRRRDLERSEALEQLRALEHGIRIKAIETSHEAIGVDTPDDLERVRRLFERQALQT